MGNKVSIVSIGDEILIGQINNTNAHWMADLLNQNGFDTIEIIAIGDTEEAISETLASSSKKSDLVLVTGGLGPTKDDITKESICKYFGSKLVMNQEVLRHVESFFIKRNRSLIDLNRKQAEVPDNCIPIHNAVGTAPGMYFHKEDIHYVFMPGVPFEMKYLMESWVIPQMSKKLSMKAIVQTTVLTHGMGESFLADLIQDWEEALPPYIKLAYLPHGL